jgi:hypothetical protein
MVMTLTMLVLLDKHGWQLVNPMHSQYILVGSSVLLLQISIGMIMTKVIGK